ncbi:hypothetical protein BJF79_39735 [Actinomadura sp. CNU-125]|uniref:hypothetical protein n=1 Tax=Actinomadura sp. CNU-125 TaxID=1904961 RepID=UPI0009647A31|nr:hypothetical protein [Actinomadura sp. CNU-125]OLT30055.1 hypothetical protein BJF79_39735 [Actinomadura sp. CNU-125]
MKALGRITAPLIAAAAAATLTAGVASAATTTIREDTAAGAPYSGAWQVSTVGPLEFSVVFLGVTVTGTCDGAELRGTVQSTGAGALTSASIGACETSNGLSSPATDLGELPANTGEVAYDPVAGGRDGTLSINGDLVFSLEGEFLGRVRTCNYGFQTGGEDGLSFDVYNRDNPNRPLPDVDDAQGAATDITLVKKPGSDFFCPSDGTGSGTAVARGESTPGSGVFDQKLYLTQ